LCERDRWNKVGEDGIKVIVTGVKAKKGVE
jgi:hypothetical protein